MVELIKLWVKQQDLPLNTFILISLLHDGEVSIAEDFAKRAWSTPNDRLISLIKAETKGYIKLLTSDIRDMESYDWTKYISVREIFIEILGKRTTAPAKRAEEILVAFREIFPEGTNAAGYRYRGDRASCMTNMKDFMKKYPEYSSEKILQATKQYVDRFAPEYNGMRQAHYFIKKNNGSDLLGELEDLGTTNDKTIITNTMI